MKAYILFIDVPDVVHKHGPTIPGTLFTRTIAHVSDRKRNVLVGVYTSRARAESEAARILEDGFADDFARRHGKPRIEQFEVDAQFRGIVS